MIMNEINFLIVALVAAFAFVSCREDEPARMLWEVTAAPSENVKVAFDPGFYEQIQIIANGNSLISGAFGHGRSVRRQTDHNYNWSSRLRSGIGISKG